MDEDGKEEWYCGRILSLVPGTVEWFNVQYDGEELKLYTDIDSGDLDIMGQRHTLIKIKLMLCL